MVHVTRRQWSAAEFDRMLEAGILTEDDRVELIEGEIVEMSPIGSRHAACVKRLNRLLLRQLGETVVLGIQDPIHLSASSEPQPDISVCRPRADDYATRHPTPADVLLLVEVADTSLLFDRDEKLPLYAQAGIPEVWLVDLVDEQVIVYSRPANETYQIQQRFIRGQLVVSMVLPSLQLPVDTMLVSLPPAVT